MDRLRQAQDHRDSQHPNQIEEQKSIGYAAFRLNGKEYTLEPVVEGQELFYIFKDLTAGKGTYPAGRFLYTEMPMNGKVVLDFNKAYNPPCAFTPYASGYAATADMPLGACPSITRNAHMSCSRNIVTARCCGQSGRFSNTRTGS